MIKEFKNYNLYSYARLSEHWQNPFIVYERFLFSDLIYRYNYIFQIEHDVKIISKNNVETKCKESQITLKENQNTFSYMPNIKHVSCFYHVLSYPFFNLNMSVCHNGFNGNTI